MRYRSASAFLIMCVLLGALLLTFGCSFERKIVVSEGSDGIAKLKAEMARMKTLLENFRAETGEALRAIAAQREEKGCCGCGKRGKPCPGADKKGCRCGFGCSCGKDDCAGTPGNPCQDIHAK